MSPAGQIVNPLASPPLTSLTAVDLVRRYNSCLFESQRPAWVRLSESLAQTIAPGRAKELEPNTASETLPAVANAERDLLKAIAQAVVNKYVQSLRPVDTTIAFKLS